MKFANFPAIERVTGKKIFSKNYTLLAIRIIIFTLLVLSISGAVLWYKGESSTYSFALAIDASGSMLAQDYKPNRIEAAKKAAIGFIDTLPMGSDVSVLSFAGIAFIKQRPTSDLQKAKEAIENISVEIVGGTAIGSALIDSINLMINEEKPKAVILLTDGQNNVGPSIEDATEYANENHVTVYTIGIGTLEGGNFTGLTFVSKLDPGPLKYISNKTDGAYYEAMNEEDLKNAYREISSVSTKSIPIKLSMPFMIVAFLLLLIEWGLVNTKYRTLP